MPDFLLIVNCILVNMLHFPRWCIYKRFEIVEITAKVTQIISTFDFLLEIKHQQSSEKGIKSKVN